MVRSGGRECDGTDQIMSEVSGTRFERASSPGRRRCEFHDPGGGHTYGKERRSGSEKVVGLAPLS